MATQEDRARLVSALSNGVLTVEYEGKKRTFQSVDQIMKAIAFIDSELAKTAGGVDTHSVAAFTRD